MVKCEYILAHICTMPAILVTFQEKTVRLEQLIYRGARFS